MNILTKYTILVLSLFITAASIGQQTNLKSEGAKSIIKKPLIVIQTGDSIVDSYMKEAVELKWQFNDNIQYMSLNASNELVKQEPKEYVRMKLQLLVGVVVHTMDHGTHTTQMGKSDYGDVMKVTLFEDDARQGYGFEISLPSNAEFSRGIAIEAIQRTCHVVNRIEELGSWNKFYMQTKSSGLEKLKSKTLLIPLEYLESPSDSVEMKEAYPHAINFVSMKFIHDKVEESNGDYAYLLVAEELVNLHVHYVCTTDGSEVLGHYHKVVQSSRTMLSGGMKHMYIDKKVFRKLFSKL